MAERIQEALDQLHIKYKTKEVTGPDKQKVTVWILTHGSLKLVVFRNLTDQYILRYQILLKPEDVEAFSKQSDGIRNDILGILTRESLDGRSGYTLIWDDKKRFSGIAIDQQIMLRDTGAHTLQRFIDGIQELVVLGMRCNVVLHKAFGLKSDNAITFSSQPGMMFG